MPRELPFQGFAKGRSFVLAWEYRGILVLVGRGLRRRGNAHEKTVLDVCAGRALPGAAVLETQRRMSQPAVRTGWVERELRPARMGGLPTFRELLTQNTLHCEASYPKLTRRY